MNTQEREQLISQCHESTPMKETSVEIIQMLVENEDGVVPYITFHEQNPFLSFGGYHSSILRLNDRLSQSNTGFSIEFEKMRGVQSLGFGLVSTQNEDEWTEDNLLDRLQRQTIKAVEQKLERDFGDNWPWTKAGDYSFVFPKYDTGYYPQPTLALIKSIAEQDSPNKAVFLTHQERNVLEAFICGGGYIDKFRAARDFGHPVELKKFMPHLNEQVAPIIGKPLAIPLQKLGYPGYSYDSDLKFRNSYLRETLNMGAGFRKITETPSYAQRELVWGDAHITVGICNLHEAFKALKYTLPPYYIGSDVPYLITINRDDLWDGFTYDKTLIAETTPFAYDLVMKLRNTPFISLNGERGDAKRKLRIKFDKVVSTLRSSGYKIEANTGVTLKNDFIFPIPSLS